MYLNIKVFRFQDIRDSQYLPSQNEQSDYGEIIHITVLL